MGAKILEPIEEYSQILPIVLQHHENFDGSGYPDGLAGHDIVYEARILAVADVFDALSSDRPYRSGWPFEQVLQFIEDNSSTKFDPEIADAFIHTVTSKKSSLPK
jgi:HD-GYP domain-containing protein (c-di-GMP phosphodiesterase class II)